MAHIPKQRHGQNARILAQGKHNDQNYVFCLIFHHYNSIALEMFCLLIFCNVYSVMAMIFISLVDPMEYILAVLAVSSLVQYSHFLYSLHPLNCEWLFLQEIINP